MEWITKEKDLYELLASKERSRHSDYIFFLDNVTVIELSKISEFNHFINCKFAGNRINFIDSTLNNDSDLKHSFHFQECELENKIFFKDCHLQEIRFSNITRSIKDFHLAPKKLEYFYFECPLNFRHNIVNDINIQIHNCQNIHYLEFLHLKSRGDLMISNCIINKLNIRHSEFKSLNIEQCNFTNVFKFNYNSIGKSLFKEN